MNMPLQQGTRRSQERESERMLEAAAARKEALGHRLHGELSGALASLEAARMTEEITRNRLLPQAELTFKSALAGYETGKVDFATLLDAQRQIRNARLALLRAQASQQQRLADIERLLGEDL
jgi:cobalt-zinc-cadmium efflux system outer membrane protein